MGSDQRSAMRIAVLAGGVSSEREISFSSGKNAAAALREAGFGTVDLLDPADKGFLDDIRAGGYDAAFIALHGAGGEDGMIQHLMEYLDMPYTGSDALASACGVDKDLSKALYERAGIPVADGVAIRRGEKVDPDAIVASHGNDLWRRGPGGPAIT